VHLALKYRQRQYQLRYLHDLIIKSHKPVIVTGDFNTFWGTHEIYLFMRAAGLRSANEKNLPSFPARIPRIELDFVLVSKEIEVTNFQVPDVRFSDHRPATSMSGAPRPHKPPWPSRCTGLVTSMRRTSAG
jgi:endonuclease/exonuclease/phosphatase family metal-dependent hydrolase